MTFQLKTKNEKILHRLKIARGHLEKVISMFESHEYCIDILHQSQAVQRALKEVDALVMENHLQTCATDAIKSGNEEQAIEEIMGVFKKVNG
jgi:DNA-binding FrmR family transcriptional regulator